MEIISTYINEHNLGEKPCNVLAQDANKTKIQDGRYKYIIHITVYLNCMCDMVSKGFSACQVRLWHYFIYCGHI